MISKALPALGVILIPFAIFAGNPTGGGTPETSEPAPEGTTQSLSAIDVDVIDDSNVTVAWTTLASQGEDVYSIQRSENGDDWRSVFSVRCTSNSKPGRTHKVYDRDLQPGQYHYRLMRADQTGNYHFSPESTVVVGEPQEVVSATEVPAK